MKIRCLDIWRKFAEKTAKITFQQYILMPYRLRHLRTKKRCYQVVNTQNGRTFSKCSTKKNAEKQMRLLRAIQYNKSFKPRTRRVRRRSSKK